MDNKVLMHGANMKIVAVPGIHMPVAVCAVSNSW